MSTPLMPPPPSILPSPSHLCLLEAIPTIPHRRGHQCAREAAPAGHVASAHMRQLHFENAYIPLLPKGSPPPAAKPAPLPPFSRMQLLEQPLCNAHRWKHAQPTHGSLQSPHHLKQPHKLAPSRGALHPGQLHDRKPICCQGVCILCYVSCLLHLNALRRNATSPPA